MYCILCTTYYIATYCIMVHTQVEATLKGLKQRSIIEILRDSLADKPYVSQTTTNKVMPAQSSSLDDTQNEVRYKLIIDPSEDESITRLLFMFGILKRDNTRSYMCSDFLGDGQLQKVNNNTVWQLAIYYLPTDQYNCCYKTFSHCRSHCDHESD